MSTDEPDRPQDESPVESFFVDLASGVLRGDTSEEFRRALGSRVTDNEAVGEALDEVAARAAEAGMSVMDDMAAEVETVDQPRGPALHITEIQDEETVMGCRLVIDRPPEDADLFVGDHEVLVVTEEVHGIHNSRHRLTWDPHGVKQEHDRDDPHCEWLITPARPELTPADPEA